MKNFVKLAVVAGLAFGALSVGSSEAKAGWGCYRPVSCYSPCRTNFSYGNWSCYSPSYSYSYVTPRYSCYSPYSYGSYSYSGWSYPSYSSCYSYAPATCYRSSYSPVYQAAYYAGNCGYGGFQSYGCGGYGGGCYAVPATYGSCGW
ncbi:MAG: hypothetical protein R3C28_17340 [Pirellulaceae bacterium]